MSDSKQKTKKESLIYDLKVIRFMFSLAFQVSKGFGIMLALSIVAASIPPLLWVILPKYVIEELMGAQRMDRLITILVSFLGGILVLDGMSKYLQRWLMTKKNRIFHYYKELLSKKVMEIDFEYLEDPNTLDLKDKSVNGLSYWGGIFGLTSQVVIIVSSAITLSGLLYIITTLNPILMILLAGVIAMITLFNNRLRVLVYKFWDKLMEFNRRFRYITSLMFDYKYGKDIRLYNMDRMLIKKNEGYIQQTHDYYINQGKREKAFASAKNYVGFFQMVLIYGFTTYLAFNNSITIGSFVMYISAATSLVLTTTTVTQSIITLKRVCQYTSPFYDFYHLPPIKSVGTKKLPPLGENALWEIEFKGVTFAYPNAKSPTLKEVSIKLTHGEKLSIVGLNGAGKTTFIKLLLRLYDPQEGQIYLNGVDIREYDYEEYLALFSVVFQDYGIFAGTVKENIAISDGDVDDEVLGAVRKVNLLDKINSLDNGIDTPLLKIFDEDGIEFSGGESGRLALARAVYKDAPFIVLDEPTAALDPIAEYEIYKHFDFIVKDKTTVYISHRLSTCRFCDVVAVFNDGSIVEYGSHSELLTNADGIYSKMWTAQSQYYV